MGYIAQNHTVTRNGSVYTITPHIGGAYCVYVSDSSDFFDKTNCLGRFDGEAQIELSPAGRVYFHIVGDDMRYSVAATRLLDIDGMNNARDIGGYNSEYGGAVKYGVFFRSERLCDASPEGIKQLAALKLKYIADYRHEGEATNFADPDFDGAVHSIKPAMIMSPKEEQFSFSKIPSMTDEDIYEMADISVNHYAEMPFNSEAYRELFSMMLSGRVPLLFHCTAGKDRTGVAAALILTALGVPYEVVERDYLLSAECRKKHIEQYIELAKSMGAKATALRFFASMLSVEASFIRLSFDTIYSKYKTFGDYMKAELGVDRAAAERLKKLYLVGK